MQSFFQDELAQIAETHHQDVYAGLTTRQIVSLSVHNSESESTAWQQNENRIDKLDIKIDKLCQRIFALAQPVATDLRFIMSSLRIGNEIERIGDIAFDVMSRSRKCAYFPGNIGRIRHTQHQSYPAQ